LKPVLKSLGLSGHLHTFRHSFISHALTQGIAEAVVRRWVGHVDDEIIRRYTHIADEVSKAAMSRLAAASASSPSPDKEVKNEDANGSPGSARFQHNRQRS
jgi:integrase